MELVSSCSYWKRVHVALAIMGFIPFMKLLDMPLRKRFRCTRKLFDLSILAQVKLLIKVMIEWCEANGRSRSDLMNVFDAEGNVPLHSAIHSGCAEVYFYY